MGVTDWHALGIHKVFDNAYEMLFILKIYEKISVLHFKAEAKGQNMKNCRWKQIFYE